ncbi:MAG: hypothetical protein H9893_03720 [Candidatus Niameybacter stercoravium]|nr:hypothetical protein [Candidatus Niameybacter stercoravium]
MAKETGFASFTPDAAKNHMREQQKQAGDPFAGVQRHKDKQKAMNKNN